MRLSLLLAAAAAATSASARRAVESTRPAAGPVRRVDASAAKLGARPELIDYIPIAATGAVVVDSSGKARFTVLTPRLIRMESILGGAVPTFEDRSTLAVMNRALPVPTFSHGESGGVLTINSSEVTLRYTVGSAFSASTLTVTSRNASSAFKSWAFDASNFPSGGNLLGTIRGLDEQGGTPLNCTTNKGTLDNGEFNHCSWGLISRTGWAIYDDTPSVCLDGNDWWSTSGVRSCKVRGLSKQTGGHLGS